MAVVQFDFRSEVLQLSTSMTLICPQEADYGPDALERSPAGFPVLYLLHGLSDDDTMWLRRTSIERYASSLGLAVVMPQVHRSYYTDEAHGGRYWTFLSEELPTIVESFFKVSTRRVDTFVAGLSMGGYGAMKWALRQPDQFAAVASLSGALGLADRTCGTGDGSLEKGLWDSIFAHRNIVGTSDDVNWLLGQSAAGALPRMYLACGTQDPLFDENLRFRAEAERLGLPVTTDFGAGAHTWGYWDDKIRDVLAWLPLKPADLAVSERSHEHRLG